MDRREFRIAIIPGDGIGRDVIGAALTVLETVNDISDDFSLDFVKLHVGETAYEKYGDPFPKATFDEINKSDTALFGAAGGEHNVVVINGMRLGFDLYAKVCPIKSLPGSKAIKPDADFILIRENTEGLYKGIGFIDGDYHVNLRVFTTKGMERIIRFCFKLAQKEHRKKVTFTHKAQILRHTDAPMRKLFFEIAQEYPEIEAEDMMIDTCAKWMVVEPERFDVVIAENANGDILSDLGAGIIGGLGLAYNGNIGDTKAIFEPTHGTAPPFADKNVANPIASIMAGMMMLEYLGEKEAASQVERAVTEVLVEGKVRTFDLDGSSSTNEVAEAVSERLQMNWTS